MDGAGRFRLDCRWRGDLAARASSQARRTPASRPTGRSRASMWPCSLPNGPASRRASSRRTGSAARRSRSARSAIARGVRPRGRRQLRLFERRDRSARARATPATWRRSPPNARASRPTRCSWPRPASSAARCRCRSSKPRIPAIALADSADARRALRARDHDDRHRAQGARAAACSWAIAATPSAAPPRAPAWSIRTWPRCCAS